jgi:hypothetical protein
MTILMMLADHASVQSDLALRDSTRSGPFHPLLGTGHARAGIQLAPLTAEKVADALP